MAEPSGDAPSVPDTPIVDVVNTVSVTFARTPFAMRLSFKP
jgi:hypothetical protein